MERFDPVEYLRLVEQYQVTHSQLVPTMFSRMLKLPEDERTGYDLSSLEIVVHAAAPCPVPVKEQMIEWWGPIILEYYGATEGLGFTACDSEEWLAHQGTVGKVVLGELHILDDDVQRAAHRRAGHDLVQDRDAVQLLQRRREDAGGNLARRDDDHGRRRRLRRRRRLPVPHRPQDVHDHLRRREHLSAGDREPVDHPPEGGRRGGVRRAQRRPRRGGEGGRAADARRRAGRRAGARAARVLPRAPRPGRSARARSTSRPSCRACRPASSTSGCCATATGPPRSDFGAL